jgi:catechol 2,3-dioxygenase-like lactoylglutathione lyase family enzyme
MKFDSLDFLYMPSSDPAAELEWFETVLGAEVVFAIEAFGTRVAMLQPAAGPAVLLAGHLEGERPVLVFRVESLDAAAAELEAAGATVSAEFGIPHGPVREIEAPGGHRLAVYELTRPGAAEHLAGRRDW